MRLHPPETAFGSQAENPDNVPIPRANATLRRRLLWAAGAVVVLALLILTPPLVNANRYRGKIADSMSASLGRPVHLDNVSLHLLPTPGFTLQNFVVSEDPGFGAEPTIRADSVEATLRVSSLWHRPVEFSTVRFVNPSVNLVRNAQGRWNLSEILLQASRVESAPTGQPHAGSTPRFPYIEATSGRVNVKFGPEKLPFSLTDADFALWLPSARQWRVRLVGHPARTDTNINDPGTVRIEGELRRAATAAEVPVSFRASWHDAPLGEASKILTGEDLDWRGALNVDATLSGTLGNAQMAAKLTLGGLRRAAFFPAHPLDLQMTCGSGFTIHPASLTKLACALPDQAPAPLLLTADRVPLQRVDATDAELRGDKIPVRWALLWASLFSSRVPTDLHPEGTITVDLSRGGVTPPAKPTGRQHTTRLPAPGAATPEAAWTGALVLSLPVASAPLADGSTGAGTGKENILSWHLVSVPGAPGGLRLEPTQVTLGPDAAATVSGSVTNTGYTLAVNGSAPAAALLRPARYLPQLGDGLEQVLPFPPTSMEPGKVDFTCTRS
ncbi:MAG TPA: AsmA family protein, partial [Acidobacteriaceae bacterium]|nr:AsmA family protein [Acidobacteriaceae bacterium]